MAENAGSEPSRTDNFWQRLLALDQNELLRPTTYNYDGLCRFYDEEIKPFVEEIRKSDDAHIVDVVNAWEAVTLARLHFLYILGE